MIKWFLSFFREDPQFIGQASSTFEKLLHKKYNNNEMDGLKLVTPQEYLHFISTIIDYNRIGYSVLMKEL